MNDNELIDELREGMRGLMDDTQVPGDFAQRARRTARRRTARQAATAAPPLMAVAGVATVLGVNAGSHGRSLPGASPAQSAQLHDTAFIVGRVRAHLAQAGQNDVVESVETGGNGNPGTDVTSTSYWYTDPQSGVEYTSGTMATPSGTAIYRQYVVGTPVEGGIRYEYTNLDPQQQLYATSSNVGPADSVGNIQDDVQQIKQELDSGQATQDGGATIDGQPTIKLTFPPSNGSTSTLYVNSQTYAPVQSLSVSPVNAQDASAGNDTTTENWLAPTAANIANAQLAQVPTGFTQVSPATLEADNPAGR